MVSFVQYGDIVFNLPRIKTFVSKIEYSIQLADKLEHILPLR